MGGAFRLVALVAAGSILLAASCFEKTTTVLVGATEHPSDSTVSPTGSPTPSATASPAPTTSAQAAQQAAIELTMALSWQHFTGFSQVCAQLSTTPTWPNAALKVTAEGPALSGSNTIPATLDAAGKGSARFTINQFGAYTVNATVTSGSQQKTATKTVSVVAGPPATPCP